MRAKVTRGKTRTLREVHRETRTHQEVTEHYLVSIIPKRSLTTANIIHISSLSCSYALLLHQIKLVSLHTVKHTYARPTKQNFLNVALDDGCSTCLVLNLYILEKCPHLTHVVLSDSKCTINIHIKLKKWKKNNQLSSQINTLHSSKMYNAAICEWQHQT